MKKKDFLGHHVDLEKARKRGFTYDPGLDCEYNQPALSIVLKSVGTAKDGFTWGKEHELVLLLVDLRIAGIFRLYWDGESEHDISRFPPAVEKKAEKLVGSILLPERKLLIGDKHHCEVGLVSEITRVVNAARDSVEIIRQCGPLILFAAAGDAWLLSPVKKQALLLVSDRREQRVDVSYGSCGLSLQWDGLYGFYRAEDKSRRTVWVMYVKWTSNTKKLRFANYPGRRISNLEQRILKEYPKVGQRSKAT